MDRAEQIKQALNRIKELKESTGYKEIEDYLLENEVQSYFFNEVDTDNKFDNEKTILKKYVLKSNQRSGFIKPQELNKGKPLFEELSKLIAEYFEGHYLLIVFIENSTRYRTDEDVELFNLIFKKTFSSHKAGTIKIKKLDTCEKTITLGEIKNIENSKTTIEVDLIYKSTLTYSGSNIKGENILFYGYNIEENPYLVELFKNAIPNKILNIIPLCGSNSFHDNVD